jgi:hypothetical protein
MEQEKEKDIQLSIERDRLEASSILAICRKALFDYDATVEATETAPADFGFSISAALELLERAEEREQNLKLARS